MAVGHVHASCLDLGEGVVPGAEPLALGDGMRSGDLVASWMKRRGDLKELVSGEPLFWNLALILIFSGASSFFKQDVVFANTYGPDDRRKVYYHKENHYQPVVRIETERRGSDLRELCTGTLVGPAIVLTNAHCVRDSVRGKTGVVRVVGEINVFVNYYRGRYADVATVRQVKLGHIDGEADSNDWAVLLLDAPFGDEYGFLEVDPNMVSSLPLVTLPGFQQDLDYGRTLFVHEDCRIRKSSSSRKKMIHHDCDAWESSSGAPMLNCSSGECKVIALNSGAYVKKNKGMRFKSWNKKWPNLSVHPDHFLDAVIDWMDRRPPRRPSRGNHRRGVRGPRGGVPEIGSLSTVKSLKQMAMHAGALSIN